MQINTLKLCQSIENAEDIFNKLVSHSKEKEELVVKNNEILKAPAKISFVGRILHWIRHFESASKINIAAREAFYQSISVAYGELIAKHITTSSAINFNTSSKKPLSAREIKSITDFMGSKEALKLLQEQEGKQQKYLDRYAKKIDKLNDFPEGKSWNNIYNEKGYQDKKIKYSDSIKFAEYENAKIKKQISNLEKLQAPK